MVGNEVPADAACRCCKALQLKAFNSVCFAFNLLHGYSVDNEDFVLHPTGGSDRWNRMGASPNPYLTGSCR